MRFYRTLVPFTVSPETEVDLWDRVKSGSDCRLELSRRPTQVTPGYPDTNPNQAGIRHLGSYRKVKTGRKVRSSYVSKTQQQHTQYVYTLARRYLAGRTGSRKRHSSGHPQELAHRCCSSRESSSDEKSPWISTIQTSIVLKRHA